MGGEIKGVGKNSVKHLECYPNTTIKEVDTDNGDYTLQYSYTHPDLKTCCDGPTQKTTDDKSLFIFTILALSVLLILSLIQPKNKEKNDELFKM